jgi:hypothetical protein
MYDGSQPRKKKTLAMVNVHMANRNVAVTVRQHLRRSWFSSWSWYVAKEDIWCAGGEKIFNHNTVKKIVHGFSFIDPDTFQTPVVQR